MPVDRFEPSTPEPPAGFGPLKQQLSSGGEDHAQGWREPVKTKGGGHVPRLDPDRAVPKVSLAEQFRARVAEGPKRGRKGR